jgi:hypothetical protein
MVMAVMRELSGHIRRARHNEMSEISEQVARRANEEVLSGEPGADAVRAH